MKFEVQKSGDIMHISDHSGCVYADLSFWTSSQAQNILDRELGEGEQFYWVNHIYNKSAEKGKGTKLLDYLVTMLKTKKIIAGLIASPPYPYPQVDFDLTLYENRLRSWYMRHGFRESQKFPVILLYDPIQ